jgi:antitoxin component of RelBE/YafQ-DinJ toxin-antitoxin module
MYGVAAIRGGRRRMETKLTVRIDRRWLEEAKHYAARHGTTVSRLVVAYLRALAAADDSVPDLPVLRRLTGVLPADVSLDEYRQHLEEKHLA